MSFFKSFFVFFIIFFICSFFHFSHLFFFLGGVAVFPLLFGGAAFHPLLWAVVRFPCLLDCGVAWSLPPPFLVVLLFFLLLLVECSLISSFFVLSLSGVAFLLSFCVVLLGMFLPSLVVLPSLPLFWVVVRFPCLLLRGAAWFPPSFWVVLLFSPSPV